MENEFSFAIGPVVIGASIITTWGIMLAITLIAWLSTRHLDMLPGSLQTTVEGIVGGYRRSHYRCRAGTWTANHAFYCYPLAVSDRCQSGGLDTGTAFAYPRSFRDLGTRCFGVFLGALVRHKNPGLEKLSASLPDPQPDLAAFSYYQRIYPHPGAGHTSIRQYDESGNGCHADFAGGRLPRADSYFNAAYH